MASGTPRCSIVIRAFNEEQHIGKLLTGIVEQTVHEREIILVDSGSTDATLAIASRFPVQVVSIQPDEFTFGRALNLGCSHASGEYLIFASAHVYPVYPDWLERLLGPFEDPEVALVYGKQRGLESSKFSERQLFESLYPNESVARQGIPICNNANAAVRRSLWLEHQYDEALPGLEDVAWANWALGQGHYLSYAAEAEVVHVHQESPSQVFNRYRREAIGLRSIRPEERFGIVDFLRLYLSNVWSDLRKSIGSGPRSPRTWWEILWFRWMQFWGTYRGFSYAGPVTEQLIHAFYYPNNALRAAPGEDRELAPIDYSTNPEAADREAVEQ